MNGPNIRKANEKDCPSLSHLIRQTVLLVNSNDYAPEVINLICMNFSEEMILKKMKKRDVFVYECNKRLLGTISFEESKLHSLFVDNKHLCQGIGTKLVHHLEQFANLRNVPKIYLSSSITAKPFYERLGYELLKFEERSDGSTYLMQKKLG